MNSELTVMWRDWDNRLAEILELERKAEILK